MNESKGDAYKEMGIEPWDVIIENFNPSAVRGYFVGETLAYLMRYNGDGDDRGGVKDLKKALAFIERLIEYDENCSSSGGVRLSSNPTFVSKEAAATSRGGGGAGHTGPYGRCPGNAPF